MAPGALWAAALAISLVHHAAGVTFTTPCGGLAKWDGTAIDGCIECMANGSCQLCHHTRLTKWSSTRNITACVPATEGATAASDTSDSNCLRADGAWCLACKPGTAFDARNKCMPTGANTQAKCRLTSKNPKCMECNPDGTCKRCSTGVLLTRAAIYINVPSQESTCLSAAQVQAAARSITVNNSWALVPNCIEYTSDFRCARCVNNWNPTADGWKCVDSARPEGNRCLGTVQYREYCAKCDATRRKCATCGWGRMPLSGECRLNCKALFGIACVACTAPGVVAAGAAAFPQALPGTAAQPGCCTRVDPLYRHGR
ncbi:hypothetical protein ABPG77_002229 [Micractinium sp. CCAP 211/92]